MGLAKAPAGQNFAAMPWGDVPAFVASFVKEELTVGRLALLVTILSAARSGEVRGAKLNHIAWTEMLWNRPPELMKNGLAHSVTLSSAAICVLRYVVARFNTAPGGLLFPNSRGVALSDNALSKIMRDAGQAYTVHGFRSSFRDWAAESMPTVPDPVAEAALSHVVSDSVIRAYKRTQFIAMRRELLEAWGDYVFPPAQRSVFQSGLAVLPIAGDPLLKERGSDQFAGARSMADARR
jgi:integrase